jgi:hypothetical protein
LLFNSVIPAVGIREIIKGKNTNWTREMEGIWSLTNLFRLEIELKCGTGQCFCTLVIHLLGESEFIDIMTIIGYLKKKLPFVMEKL